jgi:hypothetical protein
VITLENRERALRRYLIPPELCGGGEKHLLAAVERSSDPATKSGSASLRTFTATFPTAVTLTAAGTPGSISEPLPDRYEHAPEVAAALKAKPAKLRLARLPNPNAAASAPPSTDATAAPSSTPTPDENG